MATLSQLIRKELNPFDPATFKPGNFWKESQETNRDIASIHRGVQKEIEETLAAVMRDRQTRTVLMTGDTGSGKSHLLGRFKKQLNNKACFAYVGPWPDSKFIWRHILRQTIDSLIEVPAGETESQLMRWLKGLKILKKKGIAQKLLGKRNMFVHEMRASFPTAYRGKDFFNALYSLVHPDLHMSAVDWLRGESLDEDEMREIHVGRCVESEDTAQKMLSNIGWIADSSQPIVICFDQLENIPTTPNGKLDIQALLNVNSSIHNDKLRNFLLIVSMLKSTWSKYKNEVGSSDKARISKIVEIRSITLDQAEAIWADKLRPIHQRANPKPESACAPLTRAWLEHHSPGGRMTPRAALNLAADLIDTYKRKGELSAPPTGNSSSVSKSVKSSGKDSNRNRASFELTWKKEFDETGRHLRRISQFSSPELVRRLQEVLEAIGVPKVTFSVLPSPTYCSYSLSHEQGGRVAVVWTEDANMQSFYHIMRACRRASEERAYSKLFLIRHAQLGSPRNTGHRIFKDIFGGDRNSHIKPDIESVQYLETYHRLLNATAGKELLVNGRAISVGELQAFVRESHVFSDCMLLQRLGVIARDRSVISPSVPGTTGKRPPVSPPPKPWPDKKEKERAAAERYILNVMATQSLVGRQVLIENTLEQYGRLESSDAVKLIQQLCQTGRMRVLDPNARPANQLLCWVPA